ncbi:Ca-activated chloride channel family protein [Promicromonospora umidemergens]|uniref:Substrate-binding domain-containing protein n=1 Tax=Promicromonospora umidemergens TaxID=629679 RepID=A0ABP8XE38_9MICO|nr:VWA domain-containing protein [Promicromonospora umidemergens]MCP2282961.1 Ca-activated chloride channel family protein [Promicromonospora umidemergens]
METDPKRGAREDRRRITPVVAGFAVLLVVVVAGVVFWANQQPRNPVTLKVLAGSELADVMGDDDLMRDLEAATGITLEPTYVGTLQGADDIVNGGGRCETGSDAHCDLAWFSSNDYMELLWDEKQALAEAADEPWVTQSGETMRSPVVLGVKTSAAQRLGWTQDRAVSWNEIADRAAEGSLSFFMTDPATSNSGFSALVGVASGFDRNGDDLNLEDVDPARAGDLFSGLVRTAGSSQWLTEQFVADQDEADAIVNYESELIVLADSGAIAEDLVIVYPERTVYADYPVQLLAADQQDAYDDLVEWLRDAGTQEDISEVTHRRPATDSGVPDDDSVPSMDPVPVPLPEELNTANGLIDDYLRDYRDPAHTIYLLDTSRSMSGAPMNQLRQAFGDLTGNDTSITGEFARFRQGERVTILPYDTAPGRPAQFTLADPEQDLEELSPLRDHVSGLVPDGGRTAIYAALEEAYALVERSQAEGEGYYTSIVLITDGENNDPSLGLDAFGADFSAASSGSLGTPTFIVMLGDDDRYVQEMESVADLTGGRVFDAAQTSIRAAFKEIRGYQ